MRKQERGTTVLQYLKAEGTANGRERGREGEKAARKVPGCV